ncbi:hypothetical protein GCM10010413_03670 [Promicromonospora sukumoe]
MDADRGDHDGRDREGDDGPDPVPPAAALARGLATGLAAAAPAAAPAGSGLAAPGFAAPLGLAAGPPAGRGPERIGTGPCRELARPRLELAGLELAGPLARLELVRARVGLVFRNAGVR